MRGGAEITLVVCNLDKEGADKRGDIGRAQSRDGIVIVEIGPVQLLSTVLQIGFVTLLPAYDAGVAF